MKFIVFFKKKKSSTILQFIHKFKIFTTNKKKFNIINKHKQIISHIFFFLVLTLVVLEGEPVGV